MSLFLLVTGDFVKTGGMDRANYALASFLISAGHDVHLVAFRVDDDLLRLPRIVWHRVPKPGGSYTLALPLLDHFGRYWAKEISARGGRVIVNGGCCQWGDISWVHYVHAAYRPEVRHGRLRQAATLWNHRKWLSEEQRVLRSARVVVANSERTRRDLVELVEVDSNRIRTVYYGIEANEFKVGVSTERSVIRSALGWANDRPAIAFIGAMSDRRKGFDTVFAAFRTLCQDPAWIADLIVMGAGSEVSAWQERCRVAGLVERVKFLGHRRDVPRVLQACDCLVSPTRYEAYGLGVQEALCCGLPAFVTSTSGVAERYPTSLRDLLLPDPDDAADLAMRLRHWQANVNEYRSHVRSFADQLRSHSWDDMSRQMLGFIEDGFRPTAGEAKDCNRGVVGRPNPTVAAAQV